MADRAWYVAVNGNREGPFSDAQIRDRIARGQVISDTLVWAEPMTAWTKAGDVPGLVPAARRAMPPMPGAGGALATEGASGDALAADVGTWGLFGRALLVLISDIVIIPLPWVMPAFYRWFIERIRLPNGKAVSFSGKPGDIWYIFILSALCGWLGQVHYAVPLLIIPLTSWFSLIILRWVFANIIWEGRRTPLQFTGTYWQLLGWTLLSIVSIITIIGWAWVFTAMGRWVARNVQGSSMQLSFEASGWSQLWRAVLFFLSCILLIPIPWTFRWYTRWLISQFHLTSRV